MTIATFERIERGSGHAWPRAIEIDQSQVRNSGELSDFTLMRRPRVHGKFLYIGREHFWIRGVTYGTFRPDPAGLHFPTRDVVERDFRAIAEAGLNSVRVYTTPPRWLLDMAAACSLRVMIGLPWEQHIAFLDDSTRVQRIMPRVVGKFIRIGDEKFYVKGVSYGAFRPDAAKREYATRRPRALRCTRPPWRVLQDSR